MASLVNYGSSDSSDDESSPPQQLKRNLDTQKKKTVYIDLPVHDKDEEEEEHKPKRTKITSGLGLADLLPAPKNNHARPVTTTTKTASFIPHSLAKKKSKQEEQQQTSLEKEEETPLEEEEEEETSYKEKELPSHTGSFFRFGKSLKEKEEPSKSTVNVPAVGPMASVHQEEQAEDEEEEEGIAAVDAYAYDPNAMYSSDPSVYYQYQHTQEEQIHALAGIPGIRESNVQIKDVNQRDILPTNEWREQQALTATPKFDHGFSMQASKVQMKKNNIMALAAHAINNQDKLDEMFAANKKTRREAAKKYGF